MKIESGDGRQDKTSWSDYQPCPTCGAYTGKPCKSRQRGFVGVAMLTPHPDRRYKTLRGTMCLEPTRMRGVQVLCTLTRGHDKNGIAHQTKDGRRWPAHNRW